MLLGIYFIEAGLLLVVAPWTEWWDRNYFADLIPWIHQVMANESAHLLVAVTGACTVLAGMAELRVALMERWSGRPTRRSGT